MTPVIYGTGAHVIFNDGKHARSGTLKRIIPARDRRGRDISKAVLETTFTDLTGKAHASVATVRYSAIIGYQETSEVPS